MKLQVISRWPRARQCRGPRAHAPKRGGKPAGQDTSSYSPYPRRLESLAVCRCYDKRITFSPVPITVEPLYNEVLGITNDFLRLYPNNSKIFEKGPRYSEHIFPIPWPFVISRFHCLTKINYTTVTQTF